MTAQKTVLFVFSKLQLFTWPISNAPIPAPLTSLAVRRSTGGKKILIWGLGILFQVQPT